MFGICQTCPEFKYGPDCKNDCDCSPTGGECHHVTGNASTQQSLSLLLLPCFVFFQVNATVIRDGRENVAMSPVTLATMDFIVIKSASVKTVELAGRWMEAAFVLLATWAPTVPKPVCV